ncbi:cell invasion protein SipD [Salmonella enterica subsp. arizonae]|uniref:Cell invasion protein SipD n=7 Tax=Salmonella enterica TaxID=28901 RepID=A0A3S4G087_SALER|nr:cell invasion protein SipD [Salmonella enterica subsp. arizonae]
MVQDISGLGKPGDDSKLEMDNAKYQAWQAGFKAQEENLKTTLQTLTQKYSNSNSLYDNLVKVLSSTISSSLETAKSFLQG